MTTKGFCGIVASLVLLGTVAWPASALGSERRSGARRHREQFRQQRQHHRHHADRAHGRRPVSSLELHIGYERHRRDHYRHHRWHGRHHYRGPRHCRIKPGYYVKRWVPAVYEVYYDQGGFSFRVLIHKGYYEKIWVEARCMHRHRHRCRLGTHGAHPYDD